MFLLVRPCFASVRKKAKWVLFGPVSHAHVPMTNFLFEFNSALDRKLPAAFHPPPAHPIMQGASYVHTTTDSGVAGWTH